MERNTMKQTNDKGKTKRICGRRLSVLKAATIQANNCGPKKEYEAESMLFWSI
jgi:hypothetical protein